MAFTFDGPNKLIIVSGTSLDVLDMYSRYKDWLIAGNMQWEPAFSVSPGAAPDVSTHRVLGGDEIDAVAGTSIPPYTYLTNGWRVRPQEASHTLAVTSGILLVQGGGDPFVDTLGAFTVRINYQQPVQAITVATGGGGSPAAIADAVWDEPLSGHTTAGSAGRILDLALKKVKQLFGLVA